MMLQREDWEKVVKKPKQLKTDNFIVKCFLGELDPKREEAINKFAKENNFLAKICFDVKHNKLNHIY